MKRKIILKDWGVEIWFENNDQYCGKLMYCNENWSSKGKFHFHKSKDETFFIIDGVLELETKTKGQYKKYLLIPEESFRIRPKVLHRFRARSGSCRFIEVSTHHDDADVVRVSE